MKITVSTRAARSAMAKMNSIIPTLRSGMAHLAVVQATSTPGGLTFRGTDLDLDLTVAVSESKASKGTMLIPSWALRRLAQVLSPSDEIEIRSEDDEKVTLSGGGVTMRVPFADEGAKYDRYKRQIVKMDYPKEPLAPRGNSANWDSAMIDFDAVHAVSASTSSDEARPILTSVLVDHRDYAATDSYRLSHVESTHDAGTKVMLPGRACRYLSGVHGLHRIQFDSAVFIFEDEGFRLSGRLIEGEFPNYKALMPIPEVPAMVTFGPDLKVAIKRIVALSAGANTGAPLRFIPGKNNGPVRVDLGSEGWGEIEVDLLDADAKFMVAFNPHYLWEVLRDAPDEVDVIYGLTALQPAAVRWEDADERKHTRLLMPVRVA